MHELNHQLRVVALDKPMPPAAELIPAPFYNGHSVGHYEGDTLVVQTNGFNEKTFLDSDRHAAYGRNDDHGAGPPDQPDGA